MKLAFFGSSLVSAYWNGAATYYRGLLRALAERGHHVTFFEPDAYERQAHRDIPDPEWARVVVYEATEPGVRGALAQARRAELVVKCSGVGVFDDLLDREVLRLASPTRRVGFCDVDAPATLEKALSDENDAFRALIPAYDFVFTYGGGEPVRSRYLALGARECVPIYNALDPSTHHEVAPDPRFSASLGFLGNRLPDREARVDEFFFRTARELSTATFVLGGSGWHDKPLGPNVRYVGHVGTAEHNAFNRLRGWPAERTLRSGAVHGRAVPPTAPAAGAGPTARARGQGHAGISDHAARPRIRRCRAGRRLSFSETAIFEAPGTPRAVFIEGSYAGDPTNWWVPNPACSMALLRSAGFELLTRPEPEVYVCRTRPLSPLERELRALPGMRP